MTVNSMKTNEDKKVELEISVDAEVFGKALDAAFKKNAPRMNVPGFRRGKAPRKMIEKLYGEGVFYEEAVNNTYPAAYEAAVEEKGIEPVDRASIEVMKVDKEGYTFKATVTVKPDMEVTDYKGVAVEKVIYTVSDDEVNAEIEKRREQNARMLSVEDRAAQDGDIAVIDFEGFLDGAPFDGGKAEKHSLTLGSHTFVPGFEEQVIGHKPGEEFEVNITFPEDYQAEELKGKDVVFKCKMQELKMKELPALDDEFAKDVSEFDTLSDLRADLKKHLQETKDERSQTEVENKLMETVCAGMKGEIPECMYESRIDEMVQDFAYRLQSQGMNLPTYLEYMGSNMEAFRGQYRAQAENQVQTRLALEKIVKMEDIQVSDEEVEAEMAKLAEGYKMEVEKFRKMISEKNLRQNLAMNKALDLIRENAVVTEVPDGDKKEDEAPAEKPKRGRKKAAADAE